jgi:hypothetical protein
MSSEKEVVAEVHGAGVGSCFIPVPRQQSGIHSGGAARITQKKRPPGVPGGREWISPVA